MTELEAYRDDLRADDVVLALQRAPDGVFLVTARQRYQNGEPRPGFLLGVSHGGQVHLMPIGVRGGLYAVDKHAETFAVPDTLLRHYQKHPLTLPNGKQALLTTPVEKGRPITETYIQGFQQRVQAVPMEQLLREFDTLCNIVKSKDAIICSTTGQRIENKKENRYVNILPYDHSRVPLAPDGQLGTDYVNANFVSGPRADKAFIACQGPLTTTCNSFWKMIWQQQVSTVVMLTNLVEESKIKCAQYWPSDLNSTIEFKPFTVQLTASEASGSVFVKRTFALTYLPTQETRCVYQFHFTAWPDFGVPDQASQMVRFVEAVRRHKVETGTADVYSPPLVVHCSAGVGRTGTFIVISMLFDQYDQLPEGSVDIFKMVMLLRMQRPLMVQSNLQYAFIYTVFNEFLKDKA